jgi:hypothetical protein
MEQRTGGASPTRAASSPCPLLILREGVLTRTL